MTRDDRIGKPVLTLHRDAPQAPQPAADANADFRVLCVDDEIDIRTILEMSLALDPGCHAEIVADGETFLALARGENWDAFLLDGMMPVMDGYEVCRRLKADPATAGTPVVFLTARAQREEMNQAITAGATACLTKPFDPLTLTAELRRAVGR